MMVFRDDKLVAVIEEKTMSSMSKDEEFNKVYEDMIKNGIPELAKADSRSGTFATKLVVVKVSPDTMGGVVGKLESLGYTVKTI